MTKAQFADYARRSGAVRAVALFLAVASLGCGSPSAAPPQGVEVASIDRITALVEQARGKMLVVNIWATWCPPCVAEMPEFTAFYNERDVTKVEFLSLSYDDPKKIDATVRAFHKKHHLPFPVLVIESLSDLSALDRALRAELNGVLPTTLLYNPNGNVVKVWEGPIARADLENLLPSLK